MWEEITEKEGGNSWPEKGGAHYSDILVTHPAGVLQCAGALHPVHCVWCARGLRRLASRSPPQLGGVALPGCHCADGRIPGEGGRSVGGLSAVYT